MTLTGEEMGVIQCARFNFFSFMYVVGSASPGQEGP